MEHKKKDSNKHKVRPKAIDARNWPIWLSMNRERRHKIGIIILAIDALFLSAASVAIFAQGPNVATVIGRLLCAGALANLSLSIIMALIVIFPLRRGEKWALGAFSLPFCIYGIPILILDATNVADEELLSALTPQVMGLLVAVVGLSLVAPTIFGGSPKNP